MLTGKLGDLLSQTSALMEVETQLNIGIREIQEKIDKAIHHHWKVNSHHPEFYFKDGNTLEDNKEKIKMLIN